MAAIWDVVVGKAATLLRLLGRLDAAVTLVTAAASFLRLDELDRERGKLEERAWVLNDLMLSPAGYWIMQQHQMELGHQLTNALQDAYDLVEYYDETSVFLRVWRRRSMVTQFRDLRCSINAYCQLTLSIHAFLFIVEANPPLLVHT